MRHGPEKDRAPFRRGSLGAMSRYSVDANHAEVKRAFELMGASVADHAKVGGGEPDLLVGAYGVDQQVEVKTAAGSLEPSQVEFIRDWRGRPVRVVRTLDDVCAVMRELAAAARRRP